MSKNKRKYPKGYWIAVGISTRRIQDGQTVTVDGSAGTVELK
jgi:phosphohistidine swiveling domain-containing protein